VGTRHIRTAGPGTTKRAELKRVYEFRSFEDSIVFMNSAVKHISVVQHHPRWENLWRTITVWLTTWDIGHRPSIFDVQLARHLDDMFLDYDKNTSDHSKMST
jgi:pterin-4a-carbinolamine dehydratase